MNDLSDLIHRINPTTSIGWFIIGLFVENSITVKEDNSSDVSESSDVSTPDAPRMRRNALSFGSFTSNSSTASV